MLFSILIDLANCLCEKRLNLILKTKTTYSEKPKCKINEPCSGKVVLSNFWTGKRNRIPFGLEFLKTKGENCVKVEKQDLTFLRI